jgi:hypothetical protein
MIKITNKYKSDLIRKALLTLLNDKTLYTVTAFCYPMSNKVVERIRLTRPKKLPNDIRLTIGRPNYTERQFLRLCKKAKTHPKQFWLHYYPTQKQKTKQ